MKRSAQAHWEGTGKDGHGHLTTQSTVLNETQYSFSSRFENGIGTNPEELIAAAHAGCFTMKLAFNLQANGFEANSLDTTCKVTFKNGSIVSSNLNLTASVNDIDESKFSELVKDAEEKCPISMLLNTEINVEYKLN